MAARAVALCAALVAATRARELDPGACATRFDVQHDKIIRTEESREMGARYLSELDVGARAECLRLCCETELCDVFVFEEKGAGSCYLFACGPPEDFRCKFTRHANFSSGVLALSRRLAELQDQERQDTHELQLAALRQSDTMGGGRSGAVRSTSTSTSTSTTAAASGPTAGSTVRPSAAPLCSRYQFECRRGGECIAVYNACDGVPQCADGSDEAPELGCPTPAPPAPARWPHRLQQAQPPADAAAPPPPPAASHIFSHKGGLVQGGGAPYAAFEPAAAWGRRASPAPAWPAYPPAWESAWPRPRPVEAPAPDFAPPPEGARHTPRDGAEKKPPPAAAPLPRPQAAEAVEPDGPSERPAAAVLLLVLGVGLTAALGALTGCRARAARRRRARSKPFAHDADYLVNGMYL